MREEVEKELVRCVASVVTEREFIYYILSVLDQDEDRKKLINYLGKSDGITKEDIMIKAMDIKQKR